MDPVTRVFRYGKSLLRLTDTRRDVYDLDQAMRQLDARLARIEAQLGRFEAIERLEHGLRRLQDASADNVALLRREAQDRERGTAGEVARVAAATARVADALAETAAAIGTLDGRAGALEGAAEALRARVEVLDSDAVAVIGRRMRTLEAAAENVARRLDTANWQAAAVAGRLDQLSRPARPDAAPDPRHAPGGALLDRFQVALAARLGGDGDAERRHLAHLPGVARACARAEAGLVVDLGCGGGEWLRMLRQHGIEAVGVDVNEGRLAPARADGLAVVDADAASFLRGQPEGRFAAVTAFRLFEHLPLPALADCLAEIARVLCPGGLLVAETPDPEDPVVGASAFHLDPTRITKLPRIVLASLAEAAGLVVEATHPVRSGAEPVPPGAAEYALIARRPDSGFPR